MDIFGGIAATKTGLDLVKAAKELLKRESVDKNEVMDKLAEIQSLLLESREAISAGAGEIARLQSELAERKRLADIGEDMEYVEDGGFYIRKSEIEAGKNIRYCPLCWTVNKTATPLNPSVSFYTCNIHKSHYQTAAHREHDERQVRRSTPPTAWS